MKNILITISSCLVFFCFLQGCGSAEPIEQYNYPSITKYQLETAITRVLEKNTNPGLTWDTADIPLKQYRKVHAYANSTDTMKISRYKGEFVWIRIKDGKTENQYTFRYLGDPNYWKTSPDASIFIESVWNDLGLHLRQGENVGEFSGPDAKKAKKLFEAAFLSKVDKELNRKHTTGRPFLQ